MIRSRDGSTLTFPGEPCNSPLKVFTFVGSDSPTGDSPFGESAVEPYRVVNPAIAVQRHGITTIAAKAHMINPSSESSYWKWADVVHLVRTWPRSPAHFDKMLDDARRFGCKLTLDIDDWYFLPEGHPSKPFFDRVIVPYVAEYLPRFDRVICSTETLADKVRPFNARVVVVPNTFRVEDWRVRTPRKVKGLTAGVHSGGTHYEDHKVLGEVWPRLAEKYPDLTFVVAGYLPDYLKILGKRLVTLPYLPLDQFPSNVNEIDINCAPLLPGSWADCKGVIKVCESGMLGRPSVASPTVYSRFIQHGENGLLADTPAEWFDCLDALIIDPDLWQRLGRQARIDTIAHFSIDALADRWNAAMRGGLA